MSRLRRLRVPRLRPRGPAGNRVAPSSAAPVDDTSLAYLFVITYGRSGSTLLQGLLSSIPGFLIRGENAGAVFQLYKFHQRVAAARGEQSRATAPSDAWYGIGGYSDDVAYAEIRRLVLRTLIRPEPDSRVVGFKELRWFQGDLGDYVSFVRRVFPGARFIVNTRDHEEVARSKWWAKQSNARAALANTEKKMLALADALGEDAYHLHYNDYVEDPQQLRGLFTWLSVDFDEARVREVMSRKHGY